MAVPRFAESLKIVLGTRTAGGLAKLGLETVGDLLRHYPRKYGRPGEFTDSDSLVLGAHVTVMAEVRSTTVRQMRSRGGALLEVVVTDGRDALQLTFFAKRQGVLRMHEDKLRPGRIGLFTGTVGEYRGRRQLTHPDYLIVGVDAESEEEAVFEASRPIPLYPATGSVPTWRIARAVRTVLDPLTAADVLDPVPDELRERHGFVGLVEAFRKIHVPETDADWQAARDRFRYEEALVLQAALARRRAGARALTSIARPRADGGLLEALDARIPFSLTAGQREVGERISADLTADVPMQRLLQGDVGAGKTVVALRAMAQVIDAGGQAAFLAPTEVLAAQHVRTLRWLLGDLAEGGMLTGAEGATRIALLTGSQGSKQRRLALAEAASGAAGIVVGTHALLSEAVQFADLGLVVVDEQHRFGVEQRDALRARGERPPHMLVMTATPIPRTVAMTVFGDLETSVLSEKPEGRAEVTTHVVPAGKAEWVDRIWVRIREEVDAGRRAYVVCARIDGDVLEEGDTDTAETEGDERGAETSADDSSRLPLHAVVDVADKLRARAEFAGVGIGVMHGRLTPDEKDAAMGAFASGATPVLVSTTVIEVGVDVAEASAMVVLDADHFGISQLHQLRGRIGRSDIPGVCLLVSCAEEGSTAHQRLKAVASTTDGFLLAERDLELRREGDVLGSAQSGGRNSLRLLRVLRDQEVIDRARTDARGLIEADPELRDTPALAAAIKAWLPPEAEDFLERA